jgi:hypothetical protein
MKRSASFLITALVLPPVPCRRKPIQWINGLGPWAWSGCNIGPPTIKRC